MSEFYRCGTGDIRCPNACKRWFDVGDLVAWKCPANRTDCKLKLEPVDWKGRNKTLYRLLRIAPVVFGLALLTWLFWPDFLLKEARQLEKEAAAVAQDVRKAVEENEKQIARLETAVRELGPQSDAEEQVKTLAAEVRALRAESLSSSGAKQAKLKERADQVQSRLAEILAKAQHKKHTEAQKVAQGASQQIVSAGSLLETAEAAGSKQTHEEVRRIEALNVATTQLETAVGLWRQSERLRDQVLKRGPLGSGELDDAEGALQKVLVGINEAIGDVQEIAILDRAVEQLSVVRVPETDSAQPLPTADIEDLDRRIKAVGSELTSVPPNRIAEIHAAAESAVQQIRASLGTASRAGELAARKKQALATIAERRESVAKAWADADRALVVTAVAGLADRLALPLAERFLEQVLRSNSRLVKRDDAVTWLGFLRGGRKAIIEIQRTADAQGYSSLNQGADLLFIARSPSDQESTTLSSLGNLRSSDCAQVVALDGLAVFTSLGKPVENVAAPDLSQQPRLIPAADSPEAYLLPAMREFGLLGGTVKETSMLLPDAVQSSENALGVGAYSNYSRSAGRCGLASVQADPESPAFAPSPFTISTEDYKFSVRILTVHAAKTSNEIAREFSRFASGPLGQSEVARAGFVDLSPRLGSDTPYPPIPSDAKRLAPSLRFEFGKAQLDLKAAADLERVVRRIGEPDLQQQFVYLAGHTDGVGSDQTNDSLSRDRAKQVQGELTRRGLRRVSLYGFGKRFPVDTNEAESGRQKNRRVEIWVSATSPKLAAETP